MKRASWQRLVHPYLAAKPTFAITKWNIIQGLGLLIAYSKQASVAIYKTVARATNAHTIANSLNRVIVGL